MDVVDRLVLELAPEVRDLPNRQGGVNRRSIYGMYPNGGGHIYTVSEGGVNRRHACVCKSFWVPHAAIVTRQQCLQKRAVVPRRARI